MGRTQLELYPPSDILLDKTHIMFFSSPLLEVGLCIFQLCSDSDSRTSDGVRTIMKLYFYRYYTNDLKGFEINRIVFQRQLTKETMSFKF